MVNYPFAGSNESSSNSGHESRHGLDTSDKFNKKRDLFLGFLILSAIVYVLARAGGSSVQCPELETMPITDDGDLATSTSGIITLGASPPKSHSSSHQSHRKDSGPCGHKCPFS